MKQTEKERLRLVVSSIRVGVVAKTDDEIYVSSTIKFSFIINFYNLFSVLCKRRSNY